MGKLTSAFLIASLAGIALAIYITYEYLTLNFTSCSINQEFSCGGVFQSGHTSLFGIPFYLMGLAWFPAILAIGLLTSRFGKKPVNSEILLPILMVGNIFTVYLWYLELAVIHIICPLCVSLYAVNYTLTLIVLLQILREPDVPDESVGPETMKVKSETGS